MSNEELIAFLKKNVIAVACVVASLAIGVTIYLRSDELPDAEKVFEDKPKQGALLAANIEDYEHLPEQHATLVSANKTITDRMINVGQLAENEQYFYRLESDTGVKLQDLRQVPWTPPAEERAEDDLHACRLRPVGAGTYAQLMDLLRKLENGEHYCRVLSCNIHPMGEIRGSTLQMTLALELLGVQ